jgi:hypothetical protein
MRRWIVTLIAVVIVVVLATGYIGLTFNNKPSPNSAEIARDAAISYLATNYPETQNFTSNISWSGGSKETASTGTETYVYTTNDWTITLNCSAVSNPLYTIDANYTKEDVTLEWMGVCQNGTVVEQGYVVYSLDFENLLPKQALLDTCSYLIDNHKDIMPYLQDLYSWTGGRMAPAEGFVGSETYRYSGVGWNATTMYPAGWTVTVQYPVVLNPIYNVNVTYASPHDNSGNIILDWQGTWQNGTVTETHYAIAPLQV